MPRWLVTLTLLVTVALPASAQRQLDYTLFDNCPLMGGYFYSATEFSGPSWVLNERGKLPVRAQPAYTPGSALELSYVSRAGGHWEARLLRRPIRGQDDWDNGVGIERKRSPFVRPDVLHLRVHAGDTPIESLPRVSLLMDGERTSVALPLAPYLSGADAHFVPGGPSPQGWRLASIPLRDFGGVSIRVAEQVKGVKFEQSNADGNTHRLFLDEVDIRPSHVPPLRADLHVELLSVKGYERHLDVAWTPCDDPSAEGFIVERSTDGVHFSGIGFRPHWMHRYADYVGDAGGTYLYRVCLLGYDGTRSPYSRALSGSTHAMSDEELLDMVEEACARYYWDGGEACSGMSLECIPGNPHMVAVGASGFAIMSLVVCAQRNYVPRAQVADRMLKILDFLERADWFHGALGHFYNGETARVEPFFGPVDNGGDLVETSFLMQGLLTARQFFDRSDETELKIRQRITRLWEGVEWSWYRKTPNFPYLVWHWSPTYGWKIDHHLIGWNETMITYLLAIASPTHGVPPSLYYSGWASQTRDAQKYRGDGAGKMYRNGNVLFGVPLAVGGFVGGPLFFTHYSFLGMDPHGLRDRFTDYFENNRAIATINLRYCESNPRKHAGYGDAGWGLTASDGPWQYSADEPRAEEDRGKLTPTGAIASFPYVPEAAMAALKNYYEEYGNFLWGEYGFRDAFSIDDHWVNDLYMGLNQGPMVIMIENYRSGLLWRLFMRNPEISAMRRKVFKSDL